MRILIVSDCRFKSGAKGLDIAGDDLKDMSISGGRIVSSEHHITLAYIGEIDVVASDKFDAIYVDSSVGSDLDDIADALSECIAGTVVSRPESPEWYKLEASVP